MKSNHQLFLKATAVSALAASFVITTSPIHSNAKAQFTDIHPSADYYNAVLQLQSRSILSGYKDGTFRPHSELTRGQAAKIIALSLQLDTKNVRNPHFKDVHQSNPFHNSIAALVHAGIIDGFTDNTFKPEQTLTRAQMAKILTRAYKFDSSTAQKSKFTDVHPQHPFANYIHTLVQNQITKGTTSVTFSPNAPVTRGQMASFILRSEQARKGSGNFELNIMHFNDTHSQLDNVAKRVTAVKEVRKQKPDALLLDAGDVFSGSLYFNEFQGKADLEFMNLMKVDAMTFGNHEFDLGSSPEGHQALVDFIKGANFPFVSSNLDFSKDAKFQGLFNTKISSTSAGGNIYTGIVKEVKGEKVGIFGLTTVDTKNISSPGSIEITNYIQEAKKMVAEFEKMGVNKVIAITHIGYDDNPAVDNDIELAKAVDGIDIIVGGHTHTSLTKPVVIAGKEPTIIVQAGQYGENLGTLDVEFDRNGVVVAHKGELIKVADKAEDAEAATLLKKYSTVVEELKNRPTGATAEATLENPRTGGDNTKESVRKNETPLGNIITDGMLAKAKTHNSKVIMALQNGGGIRAPIEKGTITVGEVINVLPFGNTLAIMEITGAELKQAFETSFKEYPNENGGFLHVSGAKVQFDSSKPAGSRVVKVEYKDGTVYKQVVASEKYTIATNAFTAKGGDGYDVFKKAYEEGRVIDLGLSDWENFAEHLKNLKTVKPTVEGRVVDVAGQTQTPPPSAGSGGGSGNNGIINEQNFSGTPGSPKVYNGDITVRVSNVSQLQNARINGNLRIIGHAATTITFSDIQVEGNLDLTQLGGNNVNLSGIDVKGNISM